MDREERDMLGSKMPDWELPTEDTNRRTERDTNRAEEYDRKYNARDLNGEEDNTNGSRNVTHRDSKEGLTDEQMRTGHVEHSTGVRRPPNYQPRGEDFQPPAEADREEWQDQNNNSQIDPAR